MVIKLTCVGPNREAEAQRIKQNYSMRTKCHACVSAQDATDVEACDAEFFRERENGCASISQQDMLQAKS